MRDATITHTYVFEIGVKVSTSENVRSGAAERTKGRRADARRNVTAILDAALTCLVRNPEASVSEIATAAGVGRVTLYGHFPSRGELVDAVFARTVQQADEVLDEVDLTGDCREVLARLVGSSWEIIEQYRALLIAAQRELAPEQIRVHHDRPLRRVRTLIDRGKREHVFRTDLPTSWLVTTFYSVLHSAADEIAAERLSTREAAGCITTTLLAAFTPPGTPVPDIAGDTTS
jgi:TetR/AcrR family transcriptional regulator, mexCD-oprJ operon repressor